MTTLTTTPLAPLLERLFEEADASSRRRSTRPSPISPHEERIAPDAEHDRLPRPLRRA